MSVVLATDRTAAARARRYRKRRKQRSVTVAPRHARGRDVVTAIVTFAALALATVSGGFAIVGMTAIFAGAYWPIIGMGVCLECAKLSAVSWCARRYTAPLALKVAIVALVGVLMMLNSIGCYGYLAASHIGHAVTLELAVDAHAADVNARQQVQAAALADIDRRLAQIDAAVNETIRRGRTAGALALVAQETARRADLVAARHSAATMLAGLQVEAAQVDGDRAKVAADAGPVRYLAMLIGADDEAVMRLFILVVALLLDPLAVALLLAATSRSAP